MENRYQSALNHYRLSSVTLVTRQLLCDKAILGSYSWTHFLIEITMVGVVTMGTKVRSLL
jgi:hypothetical protein